MKKQPVILSFKSVDPATRNLLYVGSDDQYYCTVDGKFYDMTEEMEPCIPLTNSAFQIVDSHPL